MQICWCVKRAALAAMWPHLLSIGPTDLSGNGEALWDLFEPQRSTFHCEAVTATGGGASQRCPEDTGHDGQAGEPPEVHGGFTVCCCSFCWTEEKGNQYNLGKPKCILLIKIKPLIHCRGKTAKEAPGLYSRSVLLSAVCSFVRLFSRAVAAPILGLD